MSGCADFGHSPKVEQQNACYVNAHAKHKHERPLHGTVRLSQAVTFLGDLGGNLYERVVIVLLII